MKSTIKNKLLLSYIIITILTLSLIIAALFGYIYIRKTNNTIAQATKISQIMSNNLSASLAFDDKKSAKDILASLKVDKTIEAALIYDKNRKIFTSYVKNDTKKSVLHKIQLLHNNLLYHDRNNIIVASHIKLDNEKIGKIIILYNTNEIISTLKEIFFILFSLSLFIFLVMLLVASRLQKKLTAPIYILVNAMHTILQENNYTKTINEKTNDEFQVVFDGFNAMLQKIQKNKVALESLANTDPLTGLFNRRHFYELVHPLLARRIKKESCLFMFDIDKFKNINDTYGHDIGDIILKDLSKIISENIREGDVFSRFGGEEFVLFLPDTSLEQAKIVAEKIREKIENHTSVQDIKITVSIGISKVFEDVDNAIKASDIALYRAKESGRNRVEVEEIFA